MVTMVWVVSRFRLKAPPGTSSSCISPLTSTGQRSRASWASQPQKSATLSPQPGGKTTKFTRTCGGIGGGKKTEQLIHHEKLNLRVFRFTWRFIMYSEITKIYYRKTAGRVFTKPVHIEGTTQFSPPQQFGFHRSSHFCR